MYRENLYWCFRFKIILICTIKRTFNLLLYLHFIWRQWKGEGSGDFANKSQLPFPAVTYFCIVFLWSCMLIYCIKRKRNYGQKICSKVHPLSYLSIKVDSFNVNIVFSITLCWNSRYFPFDNLKFLVTWQEDSGLELLTYQALRRPDKNETFFSKL